MNITKRKNSKNVLFNKVHAYEWCTSEKLPRHECFNILIFYYIYRMYDFHYTIVIII